MAGRGPAARDRARARRRGAHARARPRRGHSTDDEDRVRGGLQAEGARAHARLPRRDGRAGGRGRQARARRAPQ